MFEPLYGMDRRGLLRAAAAGVVGATLPRAVSLVGEPTSEKPVGFGKAKSVLIVLLSGGPSQLDTLDPKPDAPVEVRGEFSPISTTIPGVAVCEHLPKLAQQTDRWAIVRTLAHREHNHLLATHVALTGRPTPVPRGGSDLDRVETRNDFPNYASALDFIRPRGDGMPSSVSLPNYLIEGPLTWPGQHAGLLDETLVIVMGEFGRTPKVSTLPGQTIPGRDHWAHAYSGLISGAGIMGCQVLGQTDGQAAYPVTNSWSPADICSTIFNALGIDSGATLNDPLNHPHHLLNGNVISSLYTGVTA